MSGEMLKFVIGGVIGAHGVGHVLGWMPAWGIAQFEGLSSRSWLLTSAIGDGGARALGGVLWLIPTIGFVVAAGGLFMGQVWWRPVAIASATLSLVVIALFPDALPAGSLLGAVVVNLAVLGGLLVLGWPVASSVGA